MVSLKCNILPLLIHSLKKSGHALQNIRNVIVQSKGIQTIQSSIFYYLFSNSL